MKSEATNSIAIITNKHSHYFRDLIQARRSIRGFAPDPIPKELIIRILEDANKAPSNSNTQPWNVHIVAGEKLQQLSTALLDAVKSGRFSPDFSYSLQDYSGNYAQRYVEQGELRNNELGIARDDAEGRMRAALMNYSFFDAPQVALLFMPSVGDNVRVAADVGMYAQNFLLSLVANGLSGVPQTSVGMVAETVREVLGIPDEMKMLFSVAFGYAAPDQLQKKQMPRKPLSEGVTFHY